MNNIKLIHSLIMSFLLSATAMASDPLEVRETYPVKSAPKKTGKTLLDDGSIQSVGYEGFPVMTWENLEGERLSSIGFGGGLTINQSYTFGFVGYSGTAIFDDQVLSGTEYDLGHLALYFDYSPFVEWVVHPTVGVQYGRSSLEINDNTTYFTSYVPSLGVEVNLSSLIRVSLGVQRRIVDALTVSGFDEEDFETTSLVAKIKFGSF